MVEHMSAQMGATQAYTGETGETGHWMARDRNYVTYKVGTHLPT